MPYVGQGHTFYTQAGVYYNGALQATAADATASIDSIVTSTKRKKPEGFLLPTPYERTITKYKRDHGFCNWYLDGVLNASYTGCVGYQPGGRFNSLNSWNQTFLDPGYSDSIANTALIDARNSLKDMKVNLAQAFAEREQVSRLVTDTVTDIYQLYRAIKRLDAKKGSNIIQKYRRLSKKQKQRFNDTVKSSLSPSEKWLQVQYGWKPMMSDVYGALETLGNKRIEDCWFTAHGSAKQWIKTSQVWTGYGYGVCQGYLACKYTLIGLPTNEPSTVWSRAGITNPALLAWELTPFSFVWDWFNPVGDYLSSWDATLGFRDLQFAKSERRKLLWNTWANFSYSTYYRYRDHNVYQGFKSVNGFKRSVGNGVPMPSFPGFRNPVTMTRMGNAISLLAQIFGKSR